MREDWKTRKFGEVIKLQGGSQPPKKTFIYKPKEGYVRLLQIRDFKSDNKAVYIPESDKNRMCTEDDILIGRYGASVGNICTGKAGAHNVALIKATPDPKILERRYYLYYLKSHLFQGPLMSVSSRSAQNGFNKGDLENFKIPIPPLPEQKRIVAILDEAFEAIDQAKANIQRNIENAEELFQSKLNEIFSQRGEGWEEKELSELIDLISGQHINTKDYNTENRGIGYLTGPSDFGDLYPTVSKWTEHPKRKAQSSDILVTVKGSGVGKINMLDLDEVAISRQLMAIRAKKVDTRFLYSFMKIQYDRIQELANGAAIPGISRKDVLNLKISVPDDATQKTLVDEINDLEEYKINLIERYRKKIVGIEELKKSILQKAFSGELTANEHVAA